MNPHEETNCKLVYLPKVEEKKDRLQFQIARAARDAADNGFVTDLSTSLSTSTTRANGTSGPKPTFLAQMRASWLANLCLCALMSAVAVTGHGITLLIAMLAIICTLCMQSTATERKLACSQ